MGRQSDNAEVLGGTPHAGETCTVESADPDAVQTGRQWRRSFVRFYSDIGLVDHFGCTADFIDPQLVADRTNAGRPVEGWHAVCGRSG